jgi:thiamine pyrophosphokinase
MTSGREPRTGDGDVAIVFAGGDPVPVEVAPRLAAEAFVIAADSGLAQAVALGRPVDLVVGDLDSVDLDQLAAARATGSQVEAHPPEKDETDLELALDAALARGARAVTVVGGHGGRLDHLLANLTVLASPRWAAASVDAWLGDAYAVVVRDQAVLAGEAGTLLTLVALGADARGVRTEGLRYPLDDEDLATGTSRGVSNEFVGDRARIELRSGVLLAIRPNALREAPRPGAH